MGLGGVGEDGFWRGCMSRLGRDETRREGSEEEGPCSLITQNRLLGRETTSVNAIEERGTEAR